VYADEPQAPTIIVPLRRGAFVTYHFVPRGSPKAVIIFGSGDGGWSQIENRVCTFLQQNGFHAVGIDFRKYAIASGPNSIANSNIARKLATVPTTACALHRLGRRNHATNPFRGPIL